MPSLGGLVAILLGIAVAVGFLVLTSARYVPVPVRARERSRGSRIGEATHAEATTATPAEARGETSDEPAPGGHEL